HYYGSLYRRNGVRRIADYWRYSDRCGHWIAVLDLGASSADQTLVSGYERHVGGHKKPNYLCRDLDIKVQGGNVSARSVDVIADFAEHVTFVHKLPADDSVGLELIGIHMHVTHPRVRIRGIDEEIHGLLFEGAQNKSVMRCDDLVPIRQTTVRAIVEECAGAGPNVLALMSFAARALTDEVPTMLAKIIAPWI